MLNLAQKRRLQTLRKHFAHELAVGTRNHGIPLVNEVEVLDILSIMQVSEDVAASLQTDMEFRESPMQRAEAIAAAVQTALKGVALLRQQDPEIAYKLGVVLQSELENALKE